MAYNQYYNGYQAPYYQPPMQDQLSQLRQQNQYQQPAPQQASPIIWVQGEAAARAYMVAAGNSVLLMDSDANVFYLKSTDASGMPQPMRIFDYKERTEKKPEQKDVEGNDFVTRTEFNALASRLNELAEKVNPTEVVENAK